MLLPNTVFTSTFYTRVQRRPQLLLTCKRHLSPYERLLGISVSNAWALHGDGLVGQEQTTFTPLNKSNCAHLINVLHFNYSLQIPLCPCLLRVKQLYFFYLVFGIYWRFFFIFLCRNWMFLQHWRHPSRATISTTASCPALLIPQPALQASSFLWDELLIC